MEATCSSETLVDFQRTEWCCNPKNSPHNTFFLCICGKVCYHRLPAIFFHVQRQCTLQGPAGKVEKAVGRNMAPMRSDGDSSDAESGGNANGMSYC
jgi:hypothetical protein